MTPWIIVSQAGSLLVLLAAIGYMVRGIPANKIGRAAGWYQVGILGGAGLALFGVKGLQSNVPTHLVFGVLCGIMLTGMLTSYLLPPMPRAEKVRINATIKQAVSDAGTWFRSRAGIFTILMALSPVGVGAASVAWNLGTQLYAVPMEEVKLLIGPFSIVSTLGGFWPADGLPTDLSGWATWLWAGTVLAGLSIALALCPSIRWLFEVEVLCYALLSGACKAAFWSIVIRSVGAHFAITQIILLSMAMEWAADYMRAFDGWLADDFSFTYMLIGEALLSVFCIGIARWLKRRWRILG